MQPIVPEQVVQQVDALLQRQRTEQARALLKPALAEHPTHTGLLLQHAWTDYFDDNNDAALVTAKTVLVSEPHNESARLLYFELLMQKDDFAEAERVILDLLREFPEHAHYYGRYANLMLKTLKLPKARQLAEEGLKYDPDNSECLATRTVCDFIEQPAGATSQGLQQMLVRHPQSIRTLVLVVIALEQRGDLEEAKRISHELVRAQPDNEHLVEMARQFRINTHWSMLPLWPMQRFGWAASVGLWLIALVGLRAAAKVSPQLSVTLSVIFIVYVIYSWVWPPLLKRLIKA